MYRSYLGEPDSFIPGTLNAAPSFMVTRRRARLRMPPAVSRKRRVNQRVTLTGNVDSFSGLASQLDGLDLSFKKIVRKVVKKVGKVARAGVLASVAAPLALPAAAGFKPARKVFRTIRKDVKGIVGQKIYGMLPTFAAIGATVVGAPMVGAAIQAGSSVSAAAQASRVQDAAQAEYRSQIDSAYAGYVNEMETAGEIPVSRSNFEKMLMDESGGTFPGGVPAPAVADKSGTIIAVLAGAALLL